MVFLGVSGRIYEALLWQGAMKRNLSYNLLSTMLALALLSLACGCATSKVEISRVTATGFASGDSIVIFPDGMGANSIENVRFAKCVAKAILNNKPDQRFFAADAFKDALFPWLETAPNTPDDLNILLARPLVQDRISELGVRYIIVLAGGTKVDSSWKRPFFCGYSGCLGLTWWDRKTNLLAIVWDMKAGNKAGELTATSSGTAVVPAFVIPIPFIPLTETTACSDLGRHLVEFLAQ